MLRSKDTPDGCSPRMYQSVALSVLSCFVTDEVNKYSRCNYGNTTDVITEIQQTLLRKYSRPNYRNTADVTTEMQQTFLQKYRRCNYRNTPDVLTEVQQK